MPPRPAVSEMFDQEIDERPDLGRQYIGFWINQPQRGTVVDIPIIQHADQSSRPKRLLHAPKSVSYTHLTLPTKA